MPEEAKKGLLDGIVNAVSSRDEVAALQAAKKEAEAALARATQAEARANKAEADLKTARAQAEQEVSSKRMLESRALTAEAKAKELEAWVERLKQELEKAKTRTYTVKSGDSLSKIAQQVYGDAKRWTEIYEANKSQIKDPNVIQPGQELRIP